MCLGSKVTKIGEITVGFSQDAGDRVQKTGGRYRPSIVNLKFHNHSLSAVSRCGLVCSAANSVTCHWHLRFAPLVAAQESGLPSPL